MKYYLIAMGAWNLVRAFIHSFNHGYDLIFELRMLAAVIPLCFAAITVVISEIFKSRTDIGFSFFNIPSPSKIPYFQSLDIAPAPETMEGQWIYIKDYARMYRSNGEAWIPLNTRV